MKGKRRRKYEEGQYNQPKRKWENSQWSINEWKLMKVI